MIIICKDLQSIIFEYLKVFKFGNICIPIILLFIKYREEELAIFFNKTD